MKKISFVLILCFVLSFVNIDVYGMELSASSAVLIEMNSGKVLYEKNKTKPATPASTTKIMTGLIALEKGNLKDTVTVSKKAAYQEGTSMYLEVGEKISMEELIYGLLLSSGNDSAIAIAEHISGSSEEFARFMTERAKEAGATATTFKNPNGLDEDGHITCAIDMAKITAEAMKNEKFAEIVGTTSITLSGGTYTNHNKLLKMYEGVCGVKTGYTKKSGRCLVSACKRDGATLIAVTMNAPDDWNDHMKMYDYGFGNFSFVNPVEKNRVFGNVKADNGESLNLIYEKNISLFLSADEQKRLEIINDVPLSVNLPVKKGQRIGKIGAYLDGVKLDESYLLAERDIILPEKEDIYDIFMKTVKLWFEQFS